MFLPIPLILSWRNELQISISFLLLLRKLPKDHEIRMTALQFCGLLFVSFSSLHVDVIISQVPLQARLPFCFCTSPTKKNIYIYISSIFFSGISLSEIYSHALFRKSVVPRLTLHIQQTSFLPTV